MKKINRAIIIVLDSLGVGELPDAEMFDDSGSDTLGNINKSYPLNIPNLRKLGLGNIDNVADGKLKIDNPKGAFGKFGEKSLGKDTITGHWEIAGIETKIPFKTYPNGFPDELMAQFVEKTGREFIGNYSASGVEIINALGEEHEKTGKVIVYTSADSVFQIAANVDIIPLKELYKICETARELLTGEFSCGRVIARPYKIIDGKRVRTSDRKDYSVSPPEITMLDIIKNIGMEVIAIGKISDIFNGQGITKSIHTEGNDDGINKTISTIKEDFKGIIFTNLVDFDSQYGHRRDSVGYGKALEAFDNRLIEILEAMSDNDMLVLCSDHGNDTMHKGWDHTREYIFGLFAGIYIKDNVNLGTRMSFADIGATITDILTDGKFTTSIGGSFKNDIMR